MFYSFEKYLRIKIFQIPHWTWYCFFFHKLRQFLFTLLCGLVLSLATDKYSTACVAYLFKCNLFAVGTNNKYTSLTRNIATICFQWRELVEFFNREFKIFIPNTWTSFSISAYRYEKWVFSKNVQWSGRIHISAQKLGRKILIVCGSNRFCFKNTDAVSYKRYFLVRLQLNPF